MRYEATSTEAALAANGRIADTVTGFSWSICMARDGQSPHGFTCEIFDNKTGELMHKEEYKGV